MSVNTILLLVALVLFILATLRCLAFGIHFGWAGLAFVTLTFVLGALQGLGMTLLIVLVIILIIVLLVILAQRGTFTRGAPPAKE